MDRLHIHLLQFALFLSPSLSSSLSLSFSLSLPISLPFADIECAPPLLLWILFLDPSSAPQWVREPWEFSQTQRKKKTCSQLLELIRREGAAGQFIKGTEETLLLLECDECPYRPSEGANMLQGVSDALGGFVRKNPTVAHLFWVRMAV